MQTMKLSNKKGIFITFEGIEGSGKSTQVLALVETLEKKGIMAYPTKEPGGGLASLRKVLLYEIPLDIIVKSDVELWLFLADRATHVPLMREHLERGEWVLCDRFSASTIAYQGYARGLDLERIRSEDSRARQGLESDLVILLDLDPTIGLHRVRARCTEPPTQFDQEDWLFHQKVRGGFLQESQRDPTRWLIIDATKEPHVITASIVAELERRFSV